MVFSYLYKTKKILYYMIITYIRDQACADLCSLVKLVTS